MPTQPRTHIPISSSPLSAYCFLRAPFRSLHFFLVEPTSRTPSTSLSLAAKYTITLDAIPLFEKPALAVLRHSQQHLAATVALPLHLMRQVSDNGERRRQSETEKCTPVYGSSSSATGRGGAKTNDSSHTWHSRWRSKFAAARLARTLSYVSRTSFPGPHLGGAVAVAQIACLLGKVVGAHIYRGAGWQTDGRMRGSSGDPVAKERVAARGDLQCKSD
uniref:Uncharacterized protein n=1 Tax=Oryza nivara TaxID=4536 RepID=A0A0E0HX59_ORYNI